MAIGGDRLARMIEEDRARAARKSQKKVESAENKRFRDRRQKWVNSQQRSPIPSIWPALEEAVRKWGLPAGIRRIPWVL